MLPFPFPPLLLAFMPFPPSVGESVAPKGKQVGAGVGDLELFVLKISCDAATFSNVTAEAKRKAKVLSMVGMERS